VTDCVDRVQKELQGEDSKVLNMKQIYTILTTDVVARCAFGTKLNSIEDPNNVFVRNVQVLNSDDHDPNYLTPFVAAFPFLSKAVPFLPPDVMHFFADVLGGIMKNRRENKIVQNDLVDFFNELVNRVPTEEFKRLGITESTVKSQAILFLLAGFDTTATTLTMLTYRLAKNPEKQKKLTEELDTIYEKTGGKITHDTLADLPYLNACINESLRLCPPLIRIERVCQKDWKHEESGLFIPKGMVVLMPTWPIHYNEEYFENPEEFKPERFLNKDRNESASSASINPYSVMSFGQGNRNCPGSRFAKEEINLAMALMLREFQFEAVPETKIAFKPGRPFLVQYQPVNIKVVRRQK